MMDERIVSLRGAIATKQSLWVPSNNEIASLPLAMTEKEKTQGESVYQVTIPKEIREQMDLHIGDYLLIDLAEDQIRLRPVKGLPEAVSETSRRFWEDIDQGARSSVTEEDIAGEVQAYRTQRRHKT